MINRIQKTRKDIGLNVTDRVAIQYSTNEALSAAIEIHQDYIAKETLCVDFARNDEASEHSFDVEGNELILNIGKVNT